jgi:helix-turn-helix, Psq domain
MPKIKDTKVRNKFFAYEDENMQKAIRAVQQDGLSKKKASQQFGVPRSTLIRKLSGQAPLKRKMGPTPELDGAEEVVFVNWILAMGKKGFPVHKSNLILSVKKYLTTSGKNLKYVKNSTPGRAWFNGFLKRHVTK